jgi:carboxyl-terminal processing protease
MRFSPLARRTAVGLALGALVVGVGAALPRRNPEELLGQVMTLVRDRYAASEVTDVYAAAARGLVRELGDPYSQLLSPKELEDFSRSTLGRYAGVGMEVVPVADSFYVGEVFPGGASQAAGFRRGDRLLRVDGRTVDGLALDSVVARLRGAPNSTVDVETQRGATASQTARLHRGTVRVPAVPYVVVQRGVGYVPLPGVSGTAGPDVQAAIARAVSGGAKGIVLDLRGNGGGAVDQAVRVVSGLLPPQKPVLEIRERTGSILLRTEPAPQVNVPLVVLQDGGTASAAEIIGGALQDHDRALIVGTRSFGKGLAQSVFPLDGGWALKLTTARWFTPAGRSIHRDRTAADSARHVALVGDLPAGATAGLEAKTFKTAGGRPLRGDGGIAPDVVVPYDTLAGADRAMAVALGRDGANAGRAIARLAHELSLHVDSTFTVTPAWREQLRRELAHEHVAVDSTEWAAASTWVNQLLEQRVATFAFGPGEARRRALAYDRQYQVADSLLRAATSAKDLVFRVGMTAASRGGA